MTLLASLALRFRLLTIILTCSVILLGAWAVTRIQVELLPDIDFPLVTVTAAYPGAEPQEVLEGVTIPVEEILMSLDGVENVQSVTSGSFLLAVAEFEFGTAMNTAALRAEEQIAMLTLPSGSEMPQVIRANPDEFPVLQLSVYKRGNLDKLKELVQLSIIPGIKEVPGVLSAQVPSSAMAGLSITRTNSQPSLSISVIKEPDANTIKVSEAVIEKLAESGDLLPADASMAVVFNQATDIKASIESLQREATLGALFAVVIIFAFLLSARPTFVTSVSIPVSILGALIIMYFQGMSLNILTLGGLAIAAGRVVDDSIVVMENIYRHIQMGEDRRKAALDATKEVAGAIATSTFTTIAVFAPLGFMSGIIGAFFLPFALTVTFALLASLLVSLTVVPALASILINRHEARLDRESFIERLYAVALRWALNHKAVTILIAMVAFFGSIALLPGIPKTFLPGGDENLLNATVTMNQPVESLEMLIDGGPVEQIEGILEPMRANSTVDNYQVSLGTGDASFGGNRSLTSTANRVAVLVELPRNTDAKEIAEYLRNGFAQNDREVRVSALQLGGPPSNGMELVLTGENYSVLAEAAQRVLEALQDVAGLINLETDAANTESARAHVRISRVNGELAVMISATIDDPNTQAVNQTVTQKLNSVDFPPGVRLQQGGVFEDIQDSFRQMAIAMVVGIGLVYLVMVVTLRSFFNPFVITLSLPLAAVGALTALAITQRTLGLPALMGMLMLIGLVVTNAIVLIVFVEQLRKRGFNVYDALLEGGKTRVRPILMTAFTTSFALIPLAISASKGTIIGAELATVVIGGLMTSTFLTLVVVPVVYRLLRRDSPSLEATNSDQT